MIEKEKKNVEFFIYVSLTSTDYTGQRYFWLKFDLKFGFFGFKAFQILLFENIVH